MSKVRPGGIAAEELRQFIERVEKLEEERASTGADIREVFAQAKARGFDVKAMRAILKLRKIDASERAEQEHVIDTYKHALGMLAGTPLGDAALEREETGEAA